MPHQDCAGAPESLLVLDALCEQPRRFAELKRHLGSVTPKSLTETLRRLERNGLVDREVRPTSPVSVVYSVTPLGRTLEEPLNGMLRWVVRHDGAVRDLQRWFDEQSET